MMLRITIRDHSNIIILSIFQKIGKLPHFFVQNTETIEIPILVIQTNFYAFTHEKTIFFQILYHLHHLL
jgi:hypothetical protein